MDNMGITISKAMTTISVMILASLGHLQDLINSTLDAENNAKRKDQFQNSYIGYLDPVSLVSRPKLELNRHNNRFYQTYLVPLERLPQRGLNASEHQLRKAFNWFKERIKSRCGVTMASGKNLAAFLDGLVDKLFFTVITITDELNAFKVFETLNARGVRLSATDLLKNYLFSVISTQETHETEKESLPVIRPLNSCASWTTPPLFMQRFAIHRMPYGTATKSARLNSC